MAGDDLEIRNMERDDRGAMELAVAAGCHGVYVRNALDAGQHDGLVFHRDRVDLGLAWFGPRGNLVLLGGPALDGCERQLVRQVQATHWPWRIVLGPRAWVESLAMGSVRSALARRDQVYYAGSAETVTSDLVREDMRSPEPRDRERLARATLALNASDLNIAPSRVDRRWLYDTIDTRIAEDTTRALGPVGQLWSKLDFGSDGPGGQVIEGVFTFPEHRRRGLGSQLVASCLARAPGQVSLHVAEQNVSARKAYERAGMHEVGRCRLLLLG